MEVSEHDLELLETYLDGALTPAQADELRERLSAEAALAAGLDQLRAQRTLRQQLWQQMTADQATVQKVLMRVHDSAARHGQARTWRWVQYLSAAAACIVIGFTVGRLGRAPMPGGVAATPVNPNGMEFVAQPASPQNVAPGCEVVVRDQAGGVVVRKFQTLDEARRFIEAMNRQQDAPKP